MATNTYRTWNVAVTETKKSQATMALAWFLTNVAQHCSSPQVWFAPAFPDQGMETLRQQRSTARAGLPAPKHPKFRSVPLDQGVWLDKCQGFRQSKNHASVIIASRVPGVVLFWLDLALLEQSKLLSEE